MRNLVQKSFVEAGYPGSLRSTFTHKRRKEILEALLRLTKKQGDHASAKKFELELKELKADG